MGGESNSRLTAEIIIDNSQAIPASKAAGDAMVGVLTETERANKRVSESEEKVEQASKARLSAARQVEAAVRAETAAGKPLEMELARLTERYQRLEAAMRAEVKQSGSVSSALVQEATRVKKQMAEVTAAIAAPKPGLAGLQASFASGAGQMLQFATAATAVTVGMREVKEFLGGAINEAAEAEQAEAKLTQALRSQGRFTREARQSILDYSDAMQKKLGVDDEEVTSIQTQLIMKGRLSGDALPRATAAVLDLVAAGESNETAIDAVTKAYNGNYKAIGMMLPAIRDAVKHTKDFDEVLALVNAQVGGQAAKALETFTGQTQKVTTAIGELKETVGKAMLPTIKDATADFGGLLDVTNELAGSSAGQAGLKSAFEATGEAIAGTTLGPLAQAWFWYHRINKETDELAEKDPTLPTVQYGPDLEDPKAREKRLKSEAAAEKRADSERERAHDEALRRVEERQSREEKAAEAYVAGVLKVRTAENEYAREIARLEEANKLLNAQLVDEHRQGKELDDQKIQEIATNLELIETLEKLGDAHEKAGERAEREAEARAKRDLAAAQRTNAKIAKEYEQLADAIASEMGRALDTTLNNQEDFERQMIESLRRVTQEMVAMMARQALQEAGYAYAGPLGGLAGMAAGALVGKAFGLAEGGEAVGRGRPGVDSVPALIQPEENVVDRRTNNRMKKLLDAFEAGELGGNRIPFELHVGMGSSFVPMSEAEFNRRIERQLVPALETIARDGHLDKILRGRA